MMTLEDHLGDIIRKARLMAGVSSAAAACAAGLAIEEFARLEQTGLGVKPTGFPTLAALIGLDAVKLEGIAQGWLPEPRALSRWRELRVISTADEDMTVNCFLVWDAATREAALFDTGFNAGPVVEVIERNLLQLRHVFITHGHSDHVAGLPQLRERFPQASLHWDRPEALPLERNRRSGCIQVGHLRITNRATPGHADDGVTYVISNWPEAAPPVALAGDALFAGSMGRAAAGELARRAIREEILSLPGETLVCPGHGPLTTVTEERAHNPFF